MPAASRPSDSLPMLSPGELNTLSALVLAIDTAIDVANEYYPVDSFTATAVLSGTEVLLERRDNTVEARVV